MNETPIKEYTVHVLLNETTKAYYVQADSLIIENGAMFFKQRTRLVSVFPINRTIITKIENLR